MLIDLSLLNLVTVLIVGFFFGLGFHFAGYIFGWAPRRQS